MPESAFALLRDLIHLRTGVFYHNGRISLLADRISPLMIERGLDSALDYYYLLKYDEESDTEWQRLMDALSVPETYFWREMDQIHALADEIAPQYFSAQAGPLRIWSAACATGEEPLTIALALNEREWFDRAPIEIYASDASRVNIEKARRGLFRERSFRSLPPLLREKYFTQEGAGWKIAPEIHRRVSFERANLVSRAEIARLARSQIIFCRNVFIYFSDDSIRRTLKFFHELMPAPGFLCVAASESLIKLTADFELMEIGGAFVYARR
jgi:chemotaxis protein methyltransferase CheR